MSVPGTRANADRSSVSVVRGLLERNLLDRAVTLSETRWPGSGPLVRLAHEWTGLSAADRRERLADIGPEDLARLRTLAEIQPDLARVLGDLEARGILPPTPHDDQGLALPPLVDPAAPSFSSTLQTAEDDGALADAEAPVRIRPRASREDTRAAEPQRAPRDHQRMVPLPQSSRPTLNLGLPSTTEFMEMEVERRARVVEQTESILDRVRARLDESADRIVDQRQFRPSPERGVAGESLSDEASAVEQMSAFDGDGPPDLLTIIDAYDLDAGVPVVERGVTLAERFRSAVVVEVERYESIPSQDEITTTARELNLGVVFLAPNDLGTREFWGGLERTGKSVAARAGQFPQSLSGHNLVVVQGRLTPRAIDRINEGYCDIPGTRATVRVDGRARVLMLPA